MLHPSAVAVACSLNSARKIIDLAVNEDEIFVLEGDRSLIRIGYAPNKYQRGMFLFHICLNVVYKISCRDMNFY